MNEVKSPKKPLLYYYFVAMLLVMLFNFIAMPWISEHQIKEVDYNTFVTMTEQGEVGQVEIQEQSNRILFTGTDGKSVYKTAMVPDDGLVQRLLDAGVSTTGEEIEQTSLLVSILAWVLPIIIFVALGQYMSRKMMEKMGGGGNSMMFNMGKSNAKVYVKSAEGIKFDDVAGEDEAKETLTEVGRQTAQAYNKSSQRCRNQRKLPQTSRAKSFQGNLNKSRQCSENSITDFLRPIFLFPRREKYGMMGLTAVKETGKSGFI